MKRDMIVTATALALATAFGAAHARADDTHASLDSQLQADIRNGYSAQRLLGMDVAGMNGESIGEVQNILLSKNGEARAIVISAGGVLGIGESTYRIPWSQVRLDMGQERLFVPLSASNVDRFRWGAEGNRAHSGEVHATAVLDGDVALEDGKRSGEVDDLIIGRDGDVKAVILSSDAFGDDEERYAYPVDGPLAFNTVTHYYTLPFASSDRVNLDVFDYDTYGIAGPNVGATSGSGGGVVGFDNK